MNLRAGVRGLARSARIEALSSVYESEPFACAGGPFLNAAVLISCEIGPYDLLRLCKAIEKDLGRNGSRNDARPLDLDILLFDEVESKDPDLFLPHPGCLRRPFVFVPAVEVLRSGLGLPSWSLIFQGMPIDQGLPLLKKVFGPDWMTLED